MNYYTENININKISNQVFIHYFLKKRCVLFKIIECIHFLLHKNKPIIIHNWFIFLIVKFLYEHMDQ
jgi:hypothetical protein